MKLATGLPTPVAAALGRMIARHSLLELHLSLTLYRLAGVEGTVGRVALGNPRGSDILDRMLDLAEIRQFTKFLSALPWPKFKATLAGLKKRRDWFAHGAIAYNANTKTHILWVNSGKWEIAPKTSVSRKIYPEGKTMTVVELRALRAEIEAAIKEALTLDRMVQMAFQIAPYAKGGMLSRARALSVAR
jgi:hypothetical protein